MKLIVLGGSCASPNTGAGCSGYLLIAGATTLLIDPGPGTLQELRRWTDFRRLSGVLISHMHLDHMLDLLALRYALAYNPVPAPGPVPVWLPPGGSVQLAQMAAPFDECDTPGRFGETVTVEEFQPDRPLMIREFTVSFFPTVHYVPCWAMRFAAGNKTLGYTADGGPLSSYPDFLHGVDLLVAEATLIGDGNNNSARGSLTAREAGQLGSDSGAEQLVVTHYWEESDPLEVERQASRTFGRNVILARPGLVVDV